MPKGIPKNGINKGWLKKDNKPWNKNTKGIMKVNSGSFKKGNPKPLNAYSFKKGVKFSDKTKEKMSISCSGKKKPWISGNKNYNWKGGINPKNDTIRKSLEIKLWKKACMERDNFTDQKTGIKGGDLEIHHINNFAEFPELRTSIENGITFSKKSHQEFHKKYGYKNNTIEQLEEFLENNEPIK